LQQQVGSLEQQIERSNELMKQFENRALNAEFKMKVMEMTHNEIDSITTAGAKTKSQIEIDKLKEQLRVAQNPQNSQETT
jgi:DNA replication protein DnaD